MSLSKILRSICNEVFARHSCNSLVFIAGFIKLPITLDDFNRIRNLPFQGNVRHNDPFDRILISQALENDLTIVTTDGNIPLYDVKTIW